MWRVKGIWKCPQKSICFVHLLLIIKSFYYSVPRAELRVHTLAGYRGHVPRVHPPPLREERSAEAAAQTPRRERYCVRRLLRGGQYKVTGRCYIEFNTVVGVYINTMTTTFRNIVLYLLFSIHPLILLLLFINTIFVMGQKALYF